MDTTNAKRAQQRASSSTNLKPERKDIVRTVLGAFVSRHYPETVVYSPVASSTCDQIVVRDAMTSVPLNVGEAMTRLVPWTVKVYHKGADSSL